MQVPHKAVQTVNQLDLLLGLLVIGIARLLEGSFLLLGIYFYSLCTILTAYQHPAQSRRVE
jgi:hypothetical protein